MFAFYSIRGAHYSDANAIVDIDIKCFEDAWSGEAWSKISGDPGCAISVATNYGTPIGFGVFRCYDGGKDAELFSKHVQAPGAQIVKLAVKAQYRKELLSLKLLQAAVEYASDVSAKYLFMVVPESMLYANDAAVGKWLTAVGFEARAISPDHFMAYGEPEGGVLFVQQVNQRRK